MQYGAAKTQTYNEICLEQNLAIIRVLENTRTYSDERHVKISFDNERP